MSEEPKEDQVWSKPGTPKPVVPSLVYRISQHSPEIVLQIQHYLAQNGESVTDRVSYDGVDSSARLSLALIEVLISFEQLRMELLDQTRSAPIAPAHMMLALNEILMLEPALLHIAKSAFQTHLYIWNAHEGALRPPESKKKKKGKDKEGSESSTRGRWGAASRSKPET